MLRDSLLDAIAILLPVECAGCGTDDRAVCDECRAELFPAVTPRTVDDLVVYTALRYESVARRVLFGRTELVRTDPARLLARPLAAAVERALEHGPAELVAVPTTRAAWRTRGYDPVRLLLRRARLRSVRVLAHTGGHARQKALGIEERAANRSGAFAATRDLTGRRFVVVDDVLTSGATIRDAVRAIRAAGGEVVAGAALAFTPRISAGRDPQLPAHP